MNLDKVFEESYTVIISVDGESNIQSYYDINSYVKKDELKTGNELNIPNSRYPSKLMDILVSDSTKTVFLAFTNNFKSKVELENEEKFAKFKKSKLLKVVDADLIKDNNGMFENGDIVEIKGIEEDYERVDIWDKEKYLSEYMYENEWDAFEMYE